MSKYTVTIHWTFDDSVSVHHFSEFPDAECFFRGAVKDADYYCDAHSVVLKQDGNNLQWKIYK